MRTQAQHLGYLQVGVKMQEEEEEVVAAQVHVQQHSTYGMLQPQTGC